MFLDYQNDSSPLKQDPENECFGEKELLYPGIYPKVPVKKIYPDIHQMVIEDLEDQYNTVEMLGPV